MRAITVCVDYSDYLAVTLPYNSHHFSDILVVTSPSDLSTITLCETLGVATYITDAFYRRQALFNKWLALEEGLDHFGRHGLLCILDSDIVFPANINMEYLVDRLYTPLRRMNPETTVPPESQWSSFPYSANTTEFSGYTQIFHSTDKHLPTPPWHQLDWKHAGGADTFFQANWPESTKTRPNYEVLHLGEPGANWCGRSEQGRKALERYMKLRRGIRKSKRTYENEKLR